MSLTDVMMPDVMMPDVAIGVPEEAHDVSLFQDGRVCRIGFAVQPDRLELGKADGTEG